MSQSGYGLDEMMPHPLAVWAMGLTSMRLSNLPTQHVKMAPGYSA
jgi:hypothetical protein